MGAGGESHFRRDRHHDANGKLRAAEERFGALYDAVGDVIYELAVDGEEQYRFVSVNAAFSRITGLPKEAVIGRSVREIIPAVSIDFVLAKYHEAISTRRTLHWEETSEYPTGRLTGDVCVTPIFDARNRAVFLVGAVHDLTKRRQAEVTLLEQENRLRLVVEAADIGTFDWEIASNKLTWSPRLERMFGFGPGEFAGTFEAFQQCVHPDDRERVREVLQAGMATRKPFTQEYRITWPDGSVRWLHGRGEFSFAENGEPVGVRGVAMDITARKLADRALEESHQRLKDILDSMFIFIGLFSREGVVLDCNRAPLDVTGMPREHFIGQLLTETYSFRDLPATEARLREAFRRSAKGEIVRFDAQARVRDGALIEVDVTFGPLRDAQGEVVQIVGSAVDVTERKRAENELRESQARLRSLATRLGQVREEEATRISREIHDQLGQALTGLRMDVEMLQNICRVKAPEEAVGLMRARLVEIGSAIEETMARARRVSTELRPPVLDAFGLSAALAWETREFEARSSIFCNVSVPASEPNISAARATAAFRIFQELLINIVRHAQAREVSVHLETAERSVLLTVTDDGVGFDVETRGYSGLGIWACASAPRPAGSS